MHVVVGGGVTPVSDGADLVDFVHVVKRLSDMERQCHILCTSSSSSSSSTSPAAAAASIHIHCSSHNDSTCTRRRHDDDEGEDIVLKDATKMVITMAQTFLFPLGHSRPLLPIVNKVRPRNLGFLSPLPPAKFQGFMHKTVKRSSHLCCNLFSLCVQLSA